MLEQIWQWISSANSAETAQIFFLTSVAGAGKSAIAHSVAQRCHQERILASSFFFDRNITDRPSMLFTTIARHLAGHDAGLHRQISQAIELDQDLPTAPGPRQFQELILGPCRRHRIARTLAIVIDGLDEGYNNELINVLLYEVPKLPANFRIFLTSRDGQQFNDILSQQSHIHHQSIIIGEQANLDDIAMIIPIQLAEVAQWKCLDRDWPGPKLTEAFTQRAGGLFLWVSTICEYLRDSTVDPNGQLRLLLSSDRTSELSAEEKMDELYATILRGCNWRDKAFSEGYQLLMGAIMAARTPLSARALEALHGGSLRLTVKTILQPVASLLTGIGKPDQPIQQLHLSFRDFITSRALSTPSSRFYISDQEHSARLALLCLTALNEKINPDAPGLGYVHGPNFDIPQLDADIVSEEVWYACRFWTNHVLDVKSPSVDLVNALAHFLSKCFVSWVEIIVSRGWFQSLGSVREWVVVSFTKKICLVPMLISTSEQNVMVDNSNIQELIFSPEHARTFRNMSKCLRHMGRRDEALESIKEAVALHQQLANDDPAAFTQNLAQSLHAMSVYLADVGNCEEALVSSKDSVTLHQQLANDNSAAIPDLARALGNLSSCLAGLGHRGEALILIREAVILHRQLANDHPAAFTTDLAASLSNLSNCLAALGHREEALSSIREAVTLQQQQANDHSAVFIPNLAKSLGDLSNCLADLGHREEALSSIREAVILHQQLANDRPAVFIPDLAQSLGNLSNCLAALGHREEALSSIREAVILHQQLANDHPAASTPDLANSLSNLSNRLADLGHHEHALASIKEAVTLHRQVANDHPAAFTPDLIRSLHNLSCCLRDLGNEEEALAAETEAATLCQQLVNQEASASRVS
jgi:tetratricopeptide (TPR) repeat protein